MSGLPDEVVRLHAHINYGENGSGYAYRFVERPRLGYIIVLCGRRDPLTSKWSDERVVWTLDGAEVDSKETALAGLLKPATLDQVEAKVLAGIPAEWRPYHEICDRVAPVGDHKATPELLALHRLFDKGFVEILNIETEEVDFMGFLRTTLFIRRTP